MKSIDTINKKNLTSIFNSSPMAIFIVDNKGNISYINDSALHLFKSTRSTLLKKPYIDLVSKKYAGISNEYFNKFLLGSITFHRVEMKFIRKDNKEFWGDLAVNSTQNKNGKFLHAICTLRNIDKSKIDENATIRGTGILQDYKKIEELFLLHLNINAEIVMISKKGAQLLNYSDNELIGQSWIDLCVPKRLKEKVKKSFNGILNNKKNIDDFLESPVLTKDNKEIPISWYNSIIYDDNNNITGIFCAGNEITPYELTEEKLKKSEERFRTMAETLTEGITIIEKGEMVFVNQQLCDIFEETKEELMTMMPLEHAAPEERERLREIWNQAKKEKLTFKELEYKIITKNKKVKYILNRYSAIYHEDGTVSRYIVTSDITIRKKLEEEMKKSSKLESLSVFAGGIAHDFNNILMGITGSLSLIKNSPNLDEDSKDLISDAEEASIKAHHLTKQLLTFSHGGTPIKKVMPLDIMLMDATRFALSGTNIEYSFDISDKIWSVEIDEGQLYQVLNNILINSQQAMKNGGKIQISMENLNIEKQTELPLEPGKYIQIKIHDNGSGISKKHIPFVFDPFYTTREEGSGLGLATSYSIIKKHEGHIEIQSIKNKGTTLIIYLPASSEKVETPIPKNITSKEYSGSILLMDDDDIVKKIAASMLQKIGFTVTVVSHGDDAIDEYKKRFNTEKAFSLCILDLTIRGGKGGEETISLLKEFDPQIRALVTSGYSDDDIMKNYNKYGFIGVAPKPYSIELLKESIENALNYKN